MMVVQLRRLGPNSRIKILKMPMECKTKIWLGGRGTSCQIYTRSKFASRQHFCIMYRDQKYFISDLQSANGTFLNDEKLTSEKMLTFGSIISVGVPSEMQDVPDCVVFIFEPCSDFTETQLFSSKTDCVHSESETKNDCPSKSQSPESKILEKMDVNSPENCDLEITELSDSSSSDVVLIEPNEPSSLEGPTPAKIRKIENSVKTEIKHKNTEEEDDSAYEALTQVDEPQVRSEPELLNYSLTEELIEISDSEDEWSHPEGCKSPEDGDEDDDVIILETYIRKKEPMDVLPSSLGSDLTETDVRWMGKLLKVKKEEIIPSDPVHRELISLDEPEIIQPRTEESEMAESRVEEPDMAQSEVDEPQMGQSEVDEPQMGQPEVDEPQTGQSEVDESQMGQPEVDEPQTGQSEVDEPQMGQSEVDEPQMGQPEVDEPQTGQSEVDESQMGQSEVDEPQMGQPEVDEPQTGQSEVAEPQTGQSEVAEPQTCQSEVDESEMAQSTADKTQLAQAKVDLVPLTVSLSRLSTDDEGTENTKSPPQKKRVTFNLIPQIKYFEVKFKPRLTTVEKGKMRFMRVIYNICNWNSHWLEECKKVAPDKDPPDLCEERLQKIPKKFSSHSDYMMTFIPAMLHHLWNKIRDKWVNSGESGFRQTLSCDAYGDYYYENLSVYKCTGLVQSVKAHKDLLQEGHLVLLRLHQIQNPVFTTPASEKYSKKLGYLVFGFVETKIYERYNNQVLHPALAERCASIVGDLHVIRLTILVKRRPSFLVDKQKLIQLTVVRQISQEIRIFRGICFLPESPLCSAILKPSQIELPYIEPSKTENIIFKGPIDEFQSDVVRKLSYSCFLTSSLLYSVHGAAGTGKGQVIIGLILQLLYGVEWKYKRPKIIYCSQWSVPLDEMVSKLKNYRQTMGHQFSLVRVGPVRRVKPDVKDVCLMNLASNIRNPDKRGFDAEIEVLKNADVICTTCIASGTAKMCCAFEKLWIKDRDMKVICIMDDAMSCKETDSVVPLLLGVTHFILFGDVYQLEPAFSGEKMHSLGLDMSLFWRIYKNFLNSPKELWPIVILKTQYRMNSNLCKLTSPLIYGASRQKPIVSVCNNIGSVRSHLVLLDQPPDNVDKEDMEKRELRIVSQLVKALTRVAKAVRNGVSFAVIVCDARQVESLQSLLPKREFPDVEIDQIQAFQGREFDVVTFLFDGRKIIVSWLATALTRARCSLFVLAAEHSMKANPLFLKMKEKAEKHNFLKHVHPDMTLEEFEQIVTGN